jgi:membrane glycosyltransferase
MIVLDADSVMSGETLVRLVDLMEAHPRVGIIQTAPRVIRARSLFARVQQLANQLYGPMFAAGLHYWQLGDCPYWGHNAILRMEPFMKHGALPRLAGKPPFGGDILSHDFVEAALLGRAGYSVWLAFDVVGSFEETPESLLEEMKRDQRWCQGNLQHLRLIFTEGLAPTHRALFLNGIFAYVSAALWLGFLVASTVEAALWSFVGPDYFSAGRSLFPTWPVWRPERVEGLVGAVACVLFLPKFLAILLQLRTDGAASFGGPARLMKSVFAESLASALLAPVRMAFYSRFVIRNLVGQAVGWRGGADDQGETTWRAAWRHHGADVATATVWAAGVYWLHPSAFWWLMPVAGALVLSAPLSVLASRARLGDRVAAHGWLASPEALSPPPVLAALEARLASPQAVPTGGFRAVVVDPLRNAVHGVLTRGPRNYSAGMQSVRAELIERAVEGGPDVLSVREKRFLLGDATSLVELHRRVWRLDDPVRVERWGLLAASATESARRVEPAA